MANFILRKLSVNPIIVKPVLLTPKNNSLRIHSLSVTSSACPSRQSSVATLNKVEVDNIFLRYKVVGNGPNVVLCLPGLLGSIETDCRKIFERMDKEKFTLFSWDPPGYGQSRPPNRDFSGNYYLKDAHFVAKLMDKLGIGHYSIMGWSNGGVTGGFLAADFPLMVNKLVVWGTPGFADQNIVAHSKMISNLDLWSNKLKTSLLEIYGKEYLRKMLKEWGDYVDSREQVGSDADFKECLTRIKCPTLIIHGELDPFLGIEHAKFLHKYIKYSNLFIMPGGKHNLHFQFTNEFLDVLETYLLDSPKPDN